MAKLEKTLTGNIEEIAENIKESILKVSYTATFIDSCSYGNDSCRCTVMVFERYSWMGANRATITITLFSEGDDSVKLTAIASGGAQGTTKLNTYGDEKIIKELDKIL
ncbi:MAG: hypothetical protein GX897_03655 [Clostridiales bacterium]|nr:hypothetical protein [Clostridiales bacterium]